MKYTNMPTEIFSVCMYKIVVIKIDVILVITSRTKLLWQETCGWTDFISHWIRVEVLGFGFAAGRRKTSLAAFTL